MYMIEDVSSDCCILFDHTNWTVTKDYTTIQEAVGCRMLFSMNGRFVR